MTYTPARSDLKHQQIPRIWQSPYRLRESKFHSSPVVTEEKKKIIFLKTIALAGSYKDLQDAAGWKSRVAQN